MRVCHGFVVVMVWVAIAVVVPLHAQPYTFQHHAGTTGGPGTSDGQSTAARFRFPISVALDASGGMYVADYENHTIRHIESGGRVTTFAGLANTPGTTDGPRHLARFNNPTGIAVDASGNVFVADAGNSTVRKITSSGLVTTIAGLAGIAGTDDGTGIAARFFRPRGVACDGDGNLFVVDEVAHTIRKITPAGVVTTLAGAALQAGLTNGTGPAARFSGPTDVATDPLGNLYVADGGNRVVRKVTQAGAVTTVAGTGACGFDDGASGVASFCQLRGIAVDSAFQIYLADFGRIRKIEMPAGTVSTVAGSGQNESIEGSGTGASFAGVADIAVSSGGQVYIAEHDGNTIRTAHTSVWYVTTFAGRAAEKGSSESAGDQARFRNPNDVAIDSTGAVYVTDGGNAVVRRMASGSLEPVLYAGTMSAPGTADGYPIIGRLFQPAGIAVGPSDVVYVADKGASTIRKITNGYMTTFAGAPFVTGSIDDAVGTNARFSAPEDVATDAAGNVYVADTANHTIRRITSAGAVTTLAGLAGASGSLNGTNSAARFNSPAALVMASDGNLYVADRGNHSIRKVTTAGVVTTIAGAPGEFGTSDGTGAAARFLGPTSIAADGSGNLFVADGAATIRKVTIGGVVTTVGGISMRLGTEAGTGSVARFSNPRGIVSTSAGILVVVDDQAVRRGTTALADVATADASEGAVGAVRTLSTTGPTANNWAWTLVRRPKGSTVALSGSHLQTFTFTPDVADLFTFRLTATAGTFTTGDDEPASVTEISVRGLGPATLSLSPATMPDGAQGLEYTVTLGASGGTAPYVFRHSGGTLPPGVTLNGSGVLHGVASAAGTYVFDVEATDDLSATGTRTFSVTISPAATAVEAHATAATSVAVTWPPVGGAVSYRVLRGSSTGSFAPIGAPTSATTFVDTTATANSAYLYRIVAIDAGGHESQPGPFDLATTVIYTDPTLVAGTTKVRAAHILQLRTAVNAVRAVASSGWADFSDLTLAAGDPIEAQHLTELRNALLSPTSTLSLTCPVTDPTVVPGSTRVKAAHIEELRACMR